MNFHCTAYLYNNYPVVKRSMHFSPHPPPIARTIPRPPPPGSAAYAVTQSPEMFDRVGTGDSPRRGTNRRI